MPVGKRALISGVTGQDGSYLAELLLEKGYEVHGTLRRSSVSNTERIDHIKDQIHLHYADLSDGASLHRIVDIAEPDEVYNLAAQSDVRISYDIPEYVADVTGTGALRVLDAIQSRPHIKFYQASSSELFGKVLEIPQSETTPFQPRSPYGCAKAYAYYITKNYRESYGMHASNGILFNHESPRRGTNFVTRKITRAAARIARGKQNELRLGNLDAKRDWGFAGDFVEAMWLMLQQPKADDFVIATGVTHSVSEFLNLVFGLAGLDPAKYVSIDSSLYRPAEVDILLGDPSKAAQKLGWKPRVGFAQLAEMMYRADYDNECRA